MSRIQTVLLGALVALGCAQSARSQELYGIEFAGPSNLFRVNQMNGSLTSVGAIGLDSLGDLTSDTRAGSPKLWSVRIASNQLIELNPTNASVLNTVNLNSPDDIVSIAFDAVTGKLYGNTSVGFGAPFEALYEIDPASGNSTFIGRILFDNVYALGFDQAGKLFGVSDATNELISINTSNGNGTSIATLQVGLTFDIASRPGDDVMFLTDSGTDRLWTVNTSNGNLTDIGPHIGAMQGNMVGLAFSPIPEPTGLSLLLLGLPWMLRRRNRS
jgi:hypothetical protein